jgi:hypothetical protein
MPDWSPVGKYGGYGAPGFDRHEPAAAFASSSERRIMPVTNVQRFRDFWGIGCDCFAF